MRPGTIPGLLIRGSALCAVIDPQNRCHQASPADAAHNPALFIRRVMFSALLMNVALHGLEEAAGVRYRETGVNAGTTVPGTPILGQVCRLMSNST